MLARASGGDGLGAHAELARGQAHPQQVPGAHGGGVGDHGAGGVQDHGVAALQGLLGGQRPHPGAQGAHGVPLPQGPGVHGGQRPGAPPVHVLLPEQDHVLRLGQDGPGAHGGQTGGLPVQEASHGAVQARPGPGHPGALLDDVGDDPLAGVRGGRGPQVGHPVEQRLVVLVPDGADHRGAGGRHGPDQGLVAEGQEVLEGAAAAGDHDDVHLGHGVELAQRLGHGAHRAGALDRDLPHLEVHGRPAQGRVADDVLLGVRVAPRDEADPAGEQGQGLLPGGVEEPLLGEGAPQPLEPLQQVAQAHRADAAAQHGQPAGLGPEVRFELSDHPHPLLQGTVQVGGLVGEEGHGHGDLGVDVPQGHVGDAGAPVELDDLPLDPRGRAAGDVGVQVLGEHPQRPRVLRGGPVRPLRQLPLAARRGVLLRLQIRHASCLPPDGDSRARAPPVRTVVP